VQKSITLANARMAIKNYRIATTALLKVVHESGACLGDTGQQSFIKKKIL